MTGFLGGLAAGGVSEQRSVAEDRIDTYDELERSSNDNDDSPSNLFNIADVSHKKASHADASHEKRLSDVIENVGATGQEAEIVRPDIQFVSNGRPFNVFELASTLFKTTDQTTTTTTTTSTTTTTTEESTTVAANSSEDKNDSPITWLGKFMLNGLPTKLFDFKSPFPNMGWFDSLREIQYPSTNLFMSLFK